MGYQRHHAIVVTAFAEGQIVRAQGKAHEIFGPETVSPIQESPINGYFTFFIGPDGSKEGWTESHDGDKRRDEFIAWLVAQGYDDSSNPYDWAEVQYGDDDDEQKVTRADKMAPGYEWNPGYKENRDE